MTAKLHRICLAFLLLFLGQTAKASYEDDMQVAWEVMWDQRGSPRQLYKWDNKTGNQYAFKLTGNHASADRTQIEKILAATTVLTGLNFKEETNTSLDTPVEFKFVLDAELGDTVGCEAQVLKQTNYKIEKAQIRLKNRAAYTCIAHEIMHLLGLPGHPEGKTVLTYFPWRRDAFMRLDELLLKALYSADSTPGSTPFKLLQTFSKTLQTENADALSAAQFEQIEQVFFAQKIREMEQFVQGTGQIPQIVIRSGRSQQSNIRFAKLAIAHYLGMAYRDASTVEKNMQKATQWWQFSAPKGHSGSQVLLAYALLNGNGVTMNKSEAAKWFGLAAKQNNSIGITQFKAVMATLDTDTQNTVNQTIAAFKVDENY